jgi:hypothetical protein
MKIIVLAVLLALCVPACAQNAASPGAGEPLSANAQIRADRAKADAREQSESGKRPWDRDADGKRPWDRKETRIAPGPPS